MDCYSFDHLLADYLDNSLNPAHRHEAEEHIQQCDSCRQKVDELQVLLETMRHLRPVNASESFETELFEKIREYKTSRARVHTFWNYLGRHSRGISAAAALLLFLTGSLIVWNAYHPSLDQPLPALNSSPVLSTMGNSQRKVNSGQTQKANLSGMQVSQPSMARKDSMDQKSDFLNPDLPEPRNFRDQIKLVHDRR